MPVVTMVGYVLFTFTHGRELRRHEDERLLGTILLVLGVLGVGTIGWTVRRPGVSVVTIQAIRSPYAEPTREVVRRFSVDIRGGHLPPAPPPVGNAKEQRRALPLRTTHRGAAAMGHVSVESQKPE